MSDKEIIPTKTYHEEIGCDYEIEKYRFGSPDPHLKLLNRKKSNYFLKQTTETTIIIVHKTKFVYTHSTSFPRNKLFLFKLVKDDAKKWVAGRDKIELPPETKSIKYNLNYDDSYGKITGTDINHAYWRIAFIKGIINERTYAYGLDPSCKALRLATISVLGKQRKYIKYVNGYKQEFVTVDKGNEKLQVVYNYVRRYCYGLMKELSDLLGDDFDCWKTDCVYYRETEENIKKVHDFLNSKEIEFKQLTDDFM